MTIGPSEPEEGQLIPFPTKTPPPVPVDAGKGSVEPAPNVLDGELLTDEENAALDDRLAGRQRIARTAQRVVALVVVVGESERASTAVGRATLGAGVSIGQGFGSWARRGWDGATMGVHRRQIRVAEATGNQELLAEWVDRKHHATEHRHKRLMNLPHVAKGIAVACAAGLVALAALVVLAGLVAQISGGGSFLGVITGVRTTLGWMATGVAFAWTPAWVLLPVFVITAAYREGRRRGDLPAWLVDVPAAGDVMDGLPDEGTILKALKNLNIRGFNQALKAGWVIRFRQPPTVDGKGWCCQLDLPPACPVVEVVRLKTMLAHNLVRYPIEVWPTEPQAGVLDLWVANSGVLSGPVDPWPPLADLDNATGDYFVGVPAGVTIKGDGVRGRLSEANYVVGGMMGSGKSTLVITLLLGAMLDPLVDIDVVVMANNADYDPMEPRLRSLITGAGDDTVETCLAMLTDLYGDLSLRGQALREHDARAVTRPIALEDARLRPRIMIIDECQNLFIGAHGKAAIEIASKLMSTARKYAITLMFLTPEPSKDALPRKLITIASNKACFAIGDQLGNDAVLGTGSYKSGISAVGLSPKSDEGDGDVGTCMARGFMAKPGLLRSYYVPQADAHRVTQRAMRLREEHGIQTTAIEACGDEPRNLLEDLDEVLGADRMSAPDAAALLRALAPDWGPYRQLTGQSLVAALAAVGVKVPCTHNKWWIDPVAVRRRLAELSTADLDDDE